MSASPKPTRVRTAAYIRVSTKGQEKEATPDTQERVIRQHAATHGYTVTQVIVDAHTGDEYYERPQITALRESIRRGEFDVVVAYAGDRIARHPVDRFSFIREAGTYGCRVEYATEAIDDSDEGELLEYVRALGSKDELRKIRQRARDGVQKRVSQGKRMHGCRPRYGYRWADPGIGEKTRLEIDPITGPIVQRIFNESRAGQSIRKISAGLTREGVLTPLAYARTNREASGRWSGSTISEILRDETYTGRGVALRYETERYRPEPGKPKKVKVKLRLESDLVELPGSVPALIDSDTFAEVQARLGTFGYHKRLSPRNNSDPEATLLRGGVARCGYCGKALTTRRNSRGKWEYECSVSARDIYDCPHFAIRAYILDAFVWEKVANVLNDPSQIDWELERLLKADTDPTTNDLASIDAGLQEIDRKARMLTVQISNAANDYSATVLMNQLNALGEQQAMLEAQRTEVLSRHAAWREAKDRAEYLFTYIQRSREHVAAFDYQTKRAALEWLAVEAKVYRSDHQPRIVVTAKVDLDSFHHTQGTSPSAWADPFNTRPLEPGEYLHPFDGGRRFLFGSPPSSG